MDIEIRIWDGERMHEPTGSGFVELPQTPVKEPRLLLGFNVGATSEPCSIPREAIGLDDAERRGWRFMLCSGHVDREGKKIFEGDVVRIGESHGPHTYSLVERVPGRFVIAGDTTLTYSPG